MKECDKLNSHISSKLHMICISANDIRRKVQIIKLLLCSLPQDNTTFFLHANFWAYNRKVVEFILLP
jgi:hypothetical protein